jgi:hypothetical protein
MNEMVLKLDEFGMPAWIAVMVAGFLIFWPVGLAILAYLLWSGRMGCGWHGDKSRWHARMAERWERRPGTWPGSGSAGRSAYAASGNHAFDEYREATLKRLEEESREFQTFLERLRLAKDRAEFDQFMAERKTPPAADAGGPQDAPA